MYSWELKQFIESRNYYLGGEDLKKAISTQENPQLDHIEYNAFNNKYDMWDNEGNYFGFTPMPYKEAQNKGLVKTLRRK